MYEEGAAGCSLRGILRARRLLLGTDQDTLRQGSAQRDIVGDGGEERLDQAPSQASYSPLFTPTLQLQELPQRAPALLTTSTEGRGSNIFSLAGV